MGFFNQILVKETSTDKLVDITDLDKEHYEAFLDAMNRLQIAYKVAIKHKSSSISDLLSGGFKVYVCTDCQEKNVLRDNGEITVGFCSKCEHPLWND